MKQRELSIDYIRIFSTLLILLFHFGMQYTGGFIKVTFANGTYGYLGTCLFFLFSGYLLRTRYTDNLNLPVFYKKRWLAIFPAFYIAFLGAFIVRAIASGEIFYAGNPVKLIYTFLGIDNYMNWFGIRTYALVGEWFTGMIILIYLAYPVLNYGMNRAKITFSAILFAVYFFVNISGKYLISADVSIINSFMIFWVGMLIGEFRKRIPKRYLVTGVCFLSICLLLFAKVELLEVFATQLLALFIFLPIATTFPKKTNKKWITSIGKFFAGISYEVYLVHHFLIYMLELVYEKANLEISYVVKLIIYLILTLIVSIALHYITEWVVNLFGRKERAYGNN